MNKRELIAAVAERLGTTQAAAGQAIDAVLDTIQASVAEGEKVILTGFGSFESPTRPAREARNPNTGARITVPATRVPKFKPASGFKDRVKHSPRP